jgi:threonyl-tRNA synthetase
MLRTLLRKRGKEFVEAKDEAAFYGPKIDVQMKNVNGKEDTAFTVQYDFHFPVQFNLTYIGEDGAEHRAVVVHRSSIGAIERIMAFLIEKYGGAFPLWLSPVQARVLPVSEKHNAYAKEVTDALKNANIRTELDNANESLGKKIRNAKTEKIPYLLVVGDTEVEAKTISVDSRDDGKLDPIPVADFITRAAEEIKLRK